MEKFKVSCLCVSQPTRWRALQSAILDFGKQTYENAELIIVVNSPSYANIIASFLGTRKVKRVRVFQRNIRHQLEGLVQAMCIASGEVVALWDDDNINHPQRLHEQMAVQTLLLVNGLTAFDQSLYLFIDSSELFYVHLPNDGELPVVPSTLMGFREHFPALTFDYRTSPGRKIVSFASRRGTLIYPVGTPPLHVVGVYRDSLTGYEAHRTIAQTHGLEASELLKRREWLDLHLAALAWPVPTLHFTGRDGQAYDQTDACPHEQLEPVAPRLPDDKTELVTEDVE